LNNHKTKLLFALATLLLAVPIQLMGYTSTCTQGNVGAFLTGVVFSSPLLLISVGCLVTLSMNPPTQLKTSERLILETMAVSSFALLIFHRTLLTHLWNGQSACGAEFGSGASHDNLLITIGYGLAPLAAFCLSLPLLFKHVDNFLRRSAKNYWQISDPRKVGMKRYFQFFFAAVLILLVSVALQNISENIAFSLSMLALLLVFLGWCFFINDRS
jgi:hypothetical protein